MSWDKTMYRVTMIPTTLNTSKTAEWLGQALRIDASSIKVLSLAADVEDPDPSNTATVSFRTKPELLSSPDPQWLFDSPAHAGAEDGDGGRFRIDISFDSFTPLSPVRLHVDESKLIDCIVIHGWGGHALGSFKAQGDSLYSWIRDDLPKRIPELRIWTYGYEAKLANTESIADVDNYADTFRRLLRSLRKETRANEVGRPLIFIVHSLGGWIFKKAMVLMNRSSNIDDKQNRLYTYGALFFGVPNHGMDTSAMAAMVGDTSGRFTMHFLDQSGGILHREHQHREFCEAFPWKDSKIVQFRELRKSPTLLKDETTGKWLRNGPEKLLVSPISAISGRPWETGEEYVVEIDANHSNIIKFSEGDRHEYRKVTSVLKEFAEAAHGVIKDRGGRPQDLASAESPRNPPDTNTPSLERVGSESSKDGSVFAGLFTQRDEISIFNSVTGWNDFSSRCEKLSNDGYTLISINTYKRSLLYETRFTGCWLKINGAASYCWRTSSWSDFMAKHNEYSATTRLLDFDIHDDNGTLFYLGAWGSTPATQTFVVDRNWKDFLAQWDQLSSEGKRLSRVQIFERSVGMRLTGLYEQSNASQAFRMYSNVNGLYDRYQKNVDTQQLVDFQVYGTGATRRYFGVWRGSTFAHRFSLGLDPSRFVEHSQILDSQGYRLVKAIRYSDAD